MICDGKVYKLGDDVDTDAIFPGRYLHISEPEEMAQHVFESVDPQFRERFRKGDVIVAGRNFGPGSSREQAPMGLKAFGVSCVVASSFARIFYRNALNIGLPVMICPEVSEAAQVGQQLRADTATGEIWLDGRAYQAVPPPPFLQEVIQVGGQVEWVRRRLKQNEMERKGS